MDPPISIFNPSFPSGSRFNSYSVNRADSQHASLMASAPPLCWIKQRILVFELVQVPVAPPPVTPAMRKHWVLQELYNSTLYGTAEVKGVLGRVWASSVSDLCNEMKSFSRQLFQNFWMVYRNHLWSNLMMIWSGSKTDFLSAQKRLSEYDLQQWGDFMPPSTNVQVHHQHHRLVANNETHTWFF